MLVNITTSTGNVGGLISELEGKGYGLATFAVDNKIRMAFKCPDTATLDSVKTDIDTAITNAGLTLYGYEVVE